jgi:hypothetical protein
MVALLSFSKIESNLNPFFSSSSSFRVFVFLFCFVFGFQVQGQYCMEWIEHISQNARAH